ncbi:MAG: hypothetical protein PT977_10770 [Acidobacteriota bacterium]|nr:hypothetical protein [Acidobacteriota bacterium]
MLFTVVRIVYAAFWILVVLAPLVFTKAIPEQTVPAARAFWSAVEATGFMIPLLGASYALGGLFTLFRRTAPLGLVVLSPPMAIIVLFNALLVRSASAWVVLAPVHALLLWHFRADLAPLWSGGTNRRAVAGVDAAGGRP